MKTSRVTIPLVILGCVLWFVPERPAQVLRALGDITQAAGPGKTGNLSTGSSSKETPASEEKQP